MLAVALGTLVISSGAPAVPDAPAWSSFTPAVFHDLYVSPDIASGRLDYTLTVGPNARIILGSESYAVQWVQAFFVVSRDAAGRFTATDGTVAGSWKWGKNVNPGQVYGWAGLGGHRLYPGQSRTFAFAAFDLNGTPVYPGYHLGYETPSGTVTAWYKAMGHVPDPPSLIGVGGCSATLVAVLRFRRR